MTTFLQATAGEKEERQWKDWVLEKETELRLEVPEDAAVDVKVHSVIVVGHLYCVFRLMMLNQHCSNSTQLLTGTAEVFGTEMARNKNYTISHRLKIAIFTWHGCTLRVEGEPQVIYISEETPMVMYLNSHIAVDQLRHRRELEGNVGPRVSSPPSPVHQPMGSITAGNDSRSY